MILVSDLDDTLFSEIDYVHSAYRAIGNALEADGVMSVGEAVNVLESASSIASGFDELAEAIALNVGASEKYDVQWMLNIYRYHSPKISLRSDVKQTLEFLLAKGVKIAIITDGRVRTQRAKIHALGLERYVQPSDVIISENVGADKNTNIPFKTLMMHYPHEKHWVYVGDNIAKDFHWPNLMGWITVQLLDDGKNIHRNVEVQALSPDFHPQHRIAYFSQLLNILSFEN